MSQIARIKIQQLLGADASPLRDELLSMGFDALAAQPLAALLADPGLAPLLYSALTRENAQRIAERHVLPGTERVQAALQGAKERVRDTLSSENQAELARIIASGKGPRFGWLKGAIDPADLRQLFAPVVQQVLIQFTSKLPIPGLGGASGNGANAGGLGGLVGMIGKQVQKGAGQLADVGKSVMGGIGSELERRMQTMARDFSQTAVGEFRTAVSERLSSEEGKQIVHRIRDRVVEHVLDAELSAVVDDFMHLPRTEIARMVEGAVEHNRDQPLFRALVESEIRAAIDALSQRSLGDLLVEAGVLDDAKKRATAAVEPGLKALVKSDPFGEWLDRLLAQAAQP